MLSKPFTVTVRELIAAACMLGSLAVATGSYRTKFEDSQTQITKLSANVENLRNSVEKLNQTIVKVETRLDYIEKPK